MAGYSGTPLPKKLGIKPESRVAIVGSPDGAGAAVAEIEAAATVAKGLARGRRFDVIVLFVQSQARLGAGFGKACECLDEAGGLWVAWPKKSSGVETDLNENLIRDVGLAAGLVDNKVCAIDETWSGLRFVVRVKDRKGQKGRA